VKQVKLWVFRAAHKLLTSILNGSFKVGLKYHIGWIKLFVR
jgi:hypothetical protein